MSIVKRMVASRWFQKPVAVLAAWYLQLVWKTNRFEIWPEGIYEKALAEVPIILAFWHGQHFLSPFVKGSQKGKVLVSQHRDGELNALVAERFGVEAIRGSGAHGREFQRKRGVAAFREMLDALNEGYSIALTADVPKIARIAGPGIVKLAGASGRPIYIMAVATSRRIVLKNWDRTVIHLPFGRGAFCGAGPIHVPPDADEATLEAARRRVEDELNAATARAYEIIDGKRGGERG
jgi:lysophospholipid acyltransferase (LPLAT)-like uncharacterized protein